MSLHKYSVKIITPVELETTRFNDMVSDISAVIDRYAATRDVKFDSGPASVAERERWDESHG